MLVALPMKPHLSSGEVVARWGVESFEPEKPRMEKKGSYFALVAAQESSQKAEDEEQEKHFGSKSLLRLGGDFFVNKHVRSLFL